MSKSVTAGAKKALECKRDTDRYPDFDYFLVYMKQVASEMCDPVYGTDKSLESWGTKTSLNVSTQSIKNHTSSVALSQGTSTEGNPSVKHCAVCGLGHNLFSCETFGAMIPEERFDMAFKLRLCFNCSVPGHRMRDCKRSKICSVTGCGRKHAKFLHIARIEGSGTTATQ